MLKWIFGESKKEKEERERLEAESRAAEERRLSMKREEDRQRSLAIRQAEEADRMAAERREREKFEREEAAHQLEIRRMQDRLRAEAAVQIETVGKVLDANKNAEADLMRFRSELAATEAEEARLQQAQLIRDAKRLLGDSAGEEEDEEEQEEEDEGETPPGVNVVLDPRQAWPFPASTKPE